MKRYYDLAESILKKCLEVYDLSMVDEIESMIYEEVSKNKMFTEPKKMEFVNVEECDIDPYYEGLLKSGMFFVLFPQLTGSWDLDKKNFTSLIQIWRDK